MPLQCRCLAKSFFTLLITVGGTLGFPQALARRQVTRVALPQRMRPGVDIELYSALRMAIPTGGLARKLPSIPVTVSGLR